MGQSHHAKPAYIVILSPTAICPWPSYAASITGDVKSKMTMKVLPNCVSMSIHRLIVEGNLKTVLGNTSHASAAKQQSIQSQKQTQPQHKNESDPSAMISPLDWPQWSQRKTFFQRTHW